MANPSYWLDLFTYTTWQEFLKAGGQASGFRERRWNTVKQIKPGDYLLCYLTGLSRFIGVLEVTSEAFKDTAPIWKDEKFPCRLKVRIVAKLEPETAVPVLELKDRLTIFDNLKSPHAWTGRFRGSPSRWKKEDGEAVVDAILEAEKNPKSRLFDKKKLEYRPKAIRSNKVGLVTIPDEEEKTEAESIEDVKTHTDIQWNLLKLGADIGLNVWVARNDRNREHKGQRLCDLPRMKEELPLTFDEATNRTIELIDVLWLKGNAIVAAFEIEHTTQIYSGLLRMSDLLAMQPNLNIPLYIVAPVERRDKVIKEVNRPTFTRLNPPLKEMCRFISYSSLLESISKATPFLRHMKHDFLEDLSDSCEAEDI
ncbi:EVE domain-containing protein [Gemmatimonadota bacterium]